MDPGDTGRSRQLVCGNENVNGQCKTDWIPKIMK